MLHRTNLGKSLLVFLLTANFLLGWSVCVVLCDDAAEPHGAPVSIYEKQQADESCLGSDEAEDACTLTASDAILQERQTIETTVETAEFYDARIRLEMRVRLNLPPETKQNSPPGKSPIPIFVMFCNLRI